ncbi:helicase-related protein [Halorussus sp. AFM4]|uniref:helicase-related protein n=1 Tax=Halorussus sp. AFM4 TaxID=3421651 RepID=UPI003EC153AD
MSATVGNPVELADWMNANLVVSEQDRSIKIDERPIEVDEHESRKNQIVDHIYAQSDHAPYFVFNKSKRTAEARAEGLAETPFFADEGDRNFYVELQDRLEGMEPTRKLRDLAGLMSNGVAYHHAGLPKSIRNWIEECFESGDIGAIFCTPTLAYGFDAPVQSVVVADLKRFDGAGMSYIHTYEYVQWIGRAARPGKGFEKGYVYPFYTDFDEAADRNFGDVDLERITSHVDPTSLRMAARQISRTLDAASAFFDAIQADRPDWYDDLVTSVKKGPVWISLSREMFNGVGRATIRGLRDWYSEAAASSDIALELESDTVVGGLVEAAEQVEREDQLRALLTNVSGIGQARSEILVVFAEQRGDDLDVIPPVWRKCR